jgi:hypothetical protein
MPQHFLSFLPDLFRIAIAGTASVSATHRLRASPSSLAALGPHLSAAALSTIIRSASLHRGRPPKSLLPPVAAEERPTDIYICVCGLYFILYDYNILLYSTVFVLGN